MRLRNTERAAAAESPTANPPRKWKRRAGVVALSAALLGTMPMATASAAEANVLRGHYWAQSDCENTGNRGVAAHQYEYFECRDGGPMPWEYYELYSNR